MSAATAPAWEADLRLAAGDVLTSNQRLHYYARILLDAAGRAGDFVALAEGFSDRNFDYDSAKENAVFLESGDGGDNTSLGHVDLKSSFNQLTYGGFIMGTE